MPKCSLPLTYHADPGRKNCWRYPWTSPVTDELMVQAWYPCWILLCCGVWWVDWWLVDDSNINAYHHYLALATSGGCSNAKGSWSNPWVHISHHQNCFKPCIQIQASKSHLVLFMNCFPACHSSIANKWVHHNLLSETDVTAYSLCASGHIIVFGACCCHLLRHMDVTRRSGNNTG